MSMDNISDDLREFLEASGWVPGRRVDVDRSVASLRAAGFHVSDDAIDFLVQFGFLRFDHEPSILLNNKKSFCWTKFDPSLVATRSDARIARRCASVVGDELSPVGTDGFHLTIYIAGTGGFFAGRDASVFRYADSASNLFRAMRNGDRPTLLGDWSLE
jgi:hypothetical protein